MAYIVYYYVTHQHFQTGIKLTYDVFEPGVGGAGDTFITESSMRSGVTYKLDCLEKDYDFLASVADGLKIITCTDGVLSTPPGCFGEFTNQLLPLCIVTILYFSPPYSNYSINRSSSLTPFEEALLT